MAIERDGVVINTKPSEFWWTNFKDMWANRGLALLRISPLWYVCYMLISVALVIVSLLKGDYSQAVRMMLLFMMSFALWSGAYAYRNAFIVEDEGN